MNTLQLAQINYITITPSLMNDFRENGHTLIKEILNEKEMSVCRDIINRSAYSFNTEKKIAFAERDTYGKAFL